MPGLPQAIDQAGLWNYRHHVPQVVLRWSLDPTLCHSAKRQSLLPRWLRLRWTSISLDDGLDMAGDRRSRGPDNLDLSGIERLDESDYDHGR